MTVAAVAARRQLVLRRLAAVALALVLAVTTLSAFIRLAGAGLGCQPWPACYERAPAADAPAEASPAVAAARIAHRGAAVLVLVLVLVLLMVCYADRPALATEGAAVLALLALVIGLAVLGRWSAGSRVPAVIAGNLLGGFALLGLLGWLLARSLAPPPAGLGRGLVVAALAGLALQAALGAAMSASHAAAACATLPHCNGNWWPQAAPLFTLWTERDPLASPERASLVLAHRWAGVALAALLAWAGIGLARRGHRAGTALSALAGLQVLLGLALAGGSLAAAVAHNILAAVLAPALLLLASRRRHN